jgi:AraC-like DNA-binding protein
MRPLFEQVNIPLDQSWTLFDRRLPAFPFNWHYHPEFELTLTLNSVGERFVGDHIEHYGDGDLVLVGPNLPHAWQSRERLRDDAPHRALVAWFTQAWVDTLHTHYVEFAPLRALLAESVRGLAFSADVRAQAAQRLLALCDAPPAARWLGLVEVLLQLASDTQRRSLALQGFLPVDNPRDRARLERVMSFLNAHYVEPIRLATLAELAAMSESQLQRFFKRCTRMTISDYLNQLRIGRACALLMQPDRPIGQIAAELGYGQASYFTRQFRATKGMTPMAFRRKYETRE